MDFPSKARFLRISPRKLRYVADLVRGKGLTQAFHILRCVNKRGTYFIKKLLRSAVANFNDVCMKKNIDMDEDKLYISKLLVDPGPQMKRWRPSAFGRARPIHKRFSHLTLVLSEKPSTEEEKKAKKKEKKREVKYGTKN